MGMTIRSTIKPWLITPHIANFWHLGQLTTDSDLYEKWAYNKHRSKTEMQLNHFVLLLRRGVYRDLSYDELSIIWFDRTEATIRDLLEYPVYKYILNLGIEK